MTDDDFGVDKLFAMLYRMIEYEIIHEEKTTYIQNHIDMQLGDGGEFTEWVREMCGFKQ